MTDAPERICAWVYRDGDRMHHNWRGDNLPRGPWQTEYVRADLATPLDDPRVKALVEALREYACDCDYACEQLNGTCGDTARAALSELEENK